MHLQNQSKKIDPILFVSIIFLFFSSFVILNSLQPSLFPNYFLFMIFGLVSLYLFSKVQFDALIIFSKILYVASIILLIIPLLMGATTRGVVRWIPIGPFSVQPSEIIRPFLILFFAHYITSEKVDLKRFFRIMIYFMIPFVLILVQPSLGVALLTAAAFMGVMLASSIKKKYIFAGLVLLLLMLPIVWLFLAPYQQSRVLSFADPGSDPYGAGYNSIQAMISVGSGKISGRGLGQGVQTQLFFLPEKATDFVFAAFSEEMGFVGSGLLLLAYFLLLWRLTNFSENSQGPPARAYLSGFFTVILAEIFIHIGMNMGLLPITGVPLPILSAGGSSLLGTMTGFGIALSARK